MNSRLSEKGPPHTRHTEAVRRGIDDDQVFGPVLDHVLDRIIRVQVTLPKLAAAPDLLAVEDADLLALAREGGHVPPDERTWLEVAALVENVVGRQQSLVPHLDDLTARGDADGVGERLATVRGDPVHEAEHQNAVDVFGILNEPVADHEILVDEVGAEEQVTRRVAGRDQFRKDDDVGGGSLPDLVTKPAIPAVPHGRVDLECSDLHSPPPSPGSRPSPGDFD